MSSIQYDKLSLEKRFWVLRGAVLSTFLGLLCSLIFFQIIKSNEYVKLASRNRLRILRILPPRGTITDAAGAPLAVNVRTFNISGYPLDLMDEKKVKIVASILKHGGIPVTEAEIKDNVITMLILKWVP